MMFIIFGMMLGAFLFGWYHCRNVAVILFIFTLLMAIGLFLFHIHSAKYGFRVPWILSKHNHHIQRTVSR